MLAGHPSNLAMTDFFDSTTSMWKLYANVLWDAASFLCTLLLLLLSLQHLMTTVIATPL